MKVKRMLAMILSLALFAVAVAVPVSAAMSEDATVVPRAPVCTSCDTLMRQSVAWDNTYYVVGEIPCKHQYRYGTDLIKERSGVITYVCSSCGQGYSVPTTQQINICYGYNA